ncbi:MAG: HEPN domain-containing protein [Isosphaeraceae bacterium]
MDEAKREVVRSWLLNALDDLGLARLAAEHDRAFPAGVLYHCQQAAEKALKGFLVFWDQPPPRTHNLVVLLQQTAAIEPGFLTREEAAARLTPYATRYRYPAAPFIRPDAEQVDEALDDAACIYNQVLAFLPPEVHPGAEIS